MIFSSPAATLVWDANGTTAPNPADGNGSWQASGRWWNGSANQNWADGNDAIFGIGSGSIASYVVTNSAALVQPVSITFTNPGSYTITTDGVNAGQLNLTAAGGGIGTASKGLWVGTNVNVRINVPWRNANGSDVFLGSNSVLTFAQGNYGNQGTLLLKGSGAAVSIINATNGAWNNLPGTMDLCGVTLNIMGSTVVNPGTRLDIGRPATGASGSDGVVNVSNGGQFNVNATSVADPNANLQLSRGTPALLNLLPGGLVSTISSGGSGRILLIPDSGSQAALNVSGGILNVGIGAAGVPGVSNPGLAVIGLMSGAMSYGGSASAIFNLSGGIVTAEGIQIGSGNGTFTSNPTNQINITGGILYLDATNISLPKNTGSKYALNVSGGTIAALADWWPASSAPMNLTNINGDITFQAADANAKPFDMFLAGPLSGIGGLKKTGGGTLTFSGTNIYSGVTAINDGTILVTGNGSIAASSGFTLTNDAALILMNAATANKSDRINDASPITMDGGMFAFINDGSTANFSESAGALIVNSGGNVLVTFPAATGQASTLTFSSLTHNGGTIDFQTSSAGTSQNKIFFTTPPVLGSWITVNGDVAAYDAVNGLHSAETYSDIAARGSTITNAPTDNLRINSAGSGANIQLDSSTTTVNTLQQNTTTAAIVDVAGKILRVNQIVVNAGAQSLTIGSTPGDGSLTAANMGGNLTLTDNGGFAPGLVVNATLANNVLPSSLAIAGNGTITLAAPNNTYNGGTTISNGTLVVTTGTTVSMGYTNNNGTLKVKLGAAGTTLPMDAFALSGNNPQLAFDLGGAANLAEPAMNITGDLLIASNVRVSVTNPVPGTSVLLQYSGARIGAGRFLPSNLPTGAGIIDDPTSKQVYLVYFSGPTVFVPPHDTNRIVVAVATPQQFGAVGDGITDDTAAFQGALNAANNAGNVGGGVVYVPSGVYAFSNNLIIPPGVTLQGDWTDWSRGTNGVSGTIFKVYAGVGQANGTPFITINRGALKGISFWYPNQNPSSITPYPFTLSINSDVVVENVALINSYQGILAYSAAKHVISTVIGSPLFTGIQVDEEYDISQQEDVRFSPDFWTASKLPGAPALNGPHATWMRANGVAERLYRADGEACMNVAISGYNVGIYGLLGVNGAPAASFYNSTVSNCATAYLDAAGGGNTGMEFTLCTLDGDAAVDRATNNAASVYFHTCQLIGRNGLAVRQNGGSGSTMQFQNCDVTGTVRVEGGIANFVNCDLTVAASSNHCVMTSSALYAAFTGCIFNPTRKISNAADARRLVIDGRRAITSPLPVVNWTDIKNDWLTRRPAKLDLFIVTSAPWNAIGDGVADDTAAIQSALNSASTNGGGIVYLPAGKYKLTGTLDVPGGVELRGSFPSRHGAPLYDGHVKVTVLQPYGGAGTTNGPPAIALEPDAGLVGLSITYELQDTNATAYPPTIQARGPNVYANGIMCPNAYWYVDLNTYTCTNHFFYQVDGWAIKNAFTIGNGSRGSIIECMANLSYWADNNLSASQLISAWQPPITDFVEHNLDWFVLGDCTELMVKNFDYRCRTFMLCVDQNGRGPWINGILTMVDAAVECFRFDAAADCLINIVNPEWMVTLADYPDLTGYGIISTPNFQGKARLFNAPLWGGREWDYVIQGGDVGIELAHMDYLSSFGSKVDGGVLHLINGGFEGNTSSYYNIPFNSASAGVPGKISEIIGCYAWTGLTNTLANPNNPVSLWGNFGINKLVTQTPFDVTAPKLQTSFSANAISLVWSNNMGAFNLYSTPELASPIIWTLVTNVPYYGTNRWTVTDFTANSPQLFYRLSQQ